MDQRLLDESLQAIRHPLHDGRRFSPKAREELRVLQRATLLPQNNRCGGEYLDWHMQIDGKRVIAHPSFAPPLDGDPDPHTPGRMNTESVDLGEFSEPVVPYVDFEALLGEGCFVGGIKLGFESEVKAWREKLRDHLLDLVPKN
ncbi:MAG: hypothetical protein WC813_03610 [Patescibacteria group bacterium]|jgi:hypothetical protein